MFIKEIIKQNLFVYQSFVSMKINFKNILLK